MNKLNMVSNPGSATSQLCHVGQDHSLSELNFVRSLTLQAGWGRKEEPTSKVPRATQLKVIPPYPLSSAHCI